MQAVECICHKILVFEILMKMHITQVASIFHSSRHSEMGVCSLGALPWKKLWHFNLALGCAHGRSQALHGGQLPTGARGATISKARR